MSEIKDGGPAFPVSTRQAGAPNESAYGHQDNYDTWQFGGMTLRDYFAAKAMAAVPMPQSHLHDIPEAYDRIAQHAFKMADAMLRARSQS
jgi:hypothetical protein